jgi:hypothetical protein
MRILFENALNDSTMSATASSINYPVESMIHRYKKKRWQCLISSSVITCIFNNTKSLNCIFYSYHTLNSISFKLLDSLDNVLYSGLDSDIKDIGIIYFNKIDNVKKLVITVSSLDVLRIGTLWTGVYKQVDLFTNNYKPSLIDNSVISGSTDFQYSGLYTMPVSALEFNIDNVDDFEKDYFVNQYIIKSRFMPFFIDIYETNREKMKPMYVVFDDQPQVSLRGIMFNLLIKIKEAN